MKNQLHDKYDLIQLSPAQLKRHLPGALAIFVADIAEGLDDPKTRIEKGTCWYGTARALTRLSRKAGLPTSRARGNSQNPRAGTNVGE